MMFRVNLLLVSLVAILVLGTMMDLVVAGDCNGSRCGCYKGYCWAYADGGHTRKGDWWCYTQKQGIVEKQSIWQVCNNDHDCSWDRTCGNCNQHKGNEESRRNVC